MSLLAKLLDSLLGFTVEINTRFVGDVGAVSVGVADGVTVGDCW